MAQIAEINQRLKLPDVLAPTADQLRLVGATTHRGSEAAQLAAEYVLISVSWDGDPEFPDIFGHFAPAAREPSTETVQLHTAALRELSRHLKIRQRWGIEPEGRA